MRSVETGGAAADVSRWGSKDVGDGANGGAGDRQRSRVQSRAYLHGDDSIDVSGSSGGRSSLHVAVSMVACVCDKEKSIHRAGKEVQRWGGSSGVYALA